MKDTIVAKVMQERYETGAKVQVRTAGSNKEWKDCMYTPSWDWVNYEYRIAPTEQPTATDCATVEALSAEIDTLRIQLAACGVIAMSNTRESLTKLSDSILPEYMCASISDVIRATWREIELREKINSIKNTLDC